MNCKKFIKDRIVDFNKLLKAVEVCHDGATVSTENAIQIILDDMSVANQMGRVFFFVGNGGSAAIASHSVVDFVRSCGLNAQTFFDHPLLTCMSNDYGYENVFAEPVKKLMNGHDALFAISSSGESKNIINAVCEANEKGCITTTFSGFEKDNPLRFLGNTNFYVPSNDYKYVEDVHNFILHQFIVGAFIELEK